MHNAISIYCTIYRLSLRISFLSVLMGIRRSWLAREDRRQDTSRPSWGSFSSCPPPARKRELGSSAGSRRSEEGGRKLGPPGEIDCLGRDAGGFLGAVKARPVLGKDEVPAQLAAPDQGPGDGQALGRNAGVFKAFPNSRAASRPGGPGGGRCPGTPRWFRDRRPRRRGRRNSGCGRTARLPAGSRIRRRPSSLP